MVFNPDFSKTGPRGCFFSKAITTNHGTIYFNKVPVFRENFQKHLGRIFDSKLDFFNHINEGPKGINVIKKMNLSLPRSSLLTIYKSLVWPLLDYGDVIYDHSNNSSMSNKTENVQYIKRWASSNWRY